MPIKPKGEFSLIYQHIAPHAGQRSDVLLGIGDDAAILTPAPQHRLVVASDMLIADRHFFAQQDAYDVGWKSLAVNLSDLAAMGAKPQWALLSLALTKDHAKPAWLERFMQGWSDLARQYDVELVGGDTTRGNQLTISVTVIGTVGQAQSALRRSGAVVGDDIWLSGTIGDAGLALQQMRQGVRVEDTLATRLHRPVPRVALGQALLPLATAAMDVSDGLLADLQHLMTASDVGAQLYSRDLPFTTAVKEWAEVDGWYLPLTSGDDYELLFTASSSCRDQMQQLSALLGLKLTRVGRVLSADQGLSVWDGQQLLPLPAYLGFDHFSGNL